MDSEKRAERIRWWIALVVGILAVLSLISVVRDLIVFGSVDQQWPLELVVFVAVATVPQWPIQWISALAERVTTDLPAGVSRPGFRNLGAFVGMIERPLFLGALVAGYAEFILAWLVFKGIAGYRIGLDAKQLTERRLFQLFLLNNALSLAGAGLGWFVWNALGLPTHSR